MGLPATFVLLGPRLPGDLGKSGDGPRGASSGSVDFWLAVAVPLGGPPSGLTTAATQVPARGRARWLNLGEVSAAFCAVALAGLSLLVYVLLRVIVGSHQVGELSQVFSFGVLSSLHIATK